MTLFLVRRCFRSALSYRNTSGLYNANVTPLRYVHKTSQCEKKQTKNQKGKSVQSQMWVSRQINDVYVRRAKTESYRCRSAFKLLEIDDRHQLLRPGDVVIDCGAAPGSWCEVAVKKVNAKQTEPGGKIGKVIGIDIQHMAPVEGATILYQTDFTQAESQRKIIELLQGGTVDVVLSDMAPNATGVRTLDHELIVKLCLSAVRFSTMVLREGGVFLGKIWQGQDQGLLKQAMRSCFETVRVVKPDASRTDSAEVFLLCKHFTGKKR